MKPNAINYLSLARKAGRIEVGEEPVGAAARAGHARLILVASDAPDNTCRRAKNFVAGTDQQMVVLPFTKEEMGAALGRTVVALAAMTDPAMALSFLKALEDDARYAGAVEVLTVKADRFRRHQLEEKAHEKNLRKGKKSKKETPRQESPEKRETSPKRQTPRAEDSKKQERRPFHKNEGQGQKSRFQGEKTPGKTGKGTKEYKPADRKPYKGNKSKPAGQRYATGNKVAGRKPGRKTHGGAEE